MVIQHIVSASHHFEMYRMILLLSALSIWCGFCFSVLENIRKKCVNFKKKVRKTWIIKRIWCKCGIFGIQLECCIFSAQSVPLLWNLILVGNSHGFCNKVLNWKWKTFSLETYPEKIILTEVLIKTLIYCFCWVFKHFSVQIFFTSYFEKHPSSTITAVHRLYHNNAPKVRDALYMASAKFFKVSPLSHTGIFDSDEVQSTDSPFSLPVLRLNHGNCKVFSAAASQPTPTGISARSTSELQSQLFGHEKSSSPILSMANHSATRWGPRSVLASPWLGTNL